MDAQTTEYSPDFQQFLQQVEAALLKSSAAARRLAEQTGTRFITRESLEEETGGTTENAAVQPDAGKAGMGDIPL